MGSKEKKEVKDWLIPLSTNLQQCLDGKKGNLKHPISRKEFAEIIGASSDSKIKNVFSRQNGMKVEDLIKAADYFGVTVDWLIGREKVSLPDPDLRTISEYTGLSEESIKMLHLLHTGRNVIVTYETLDDCLENQAKDDNALQDQSHHDIEYAFHEMPIEILPNEFAIDALNKILEMDYALLTEERALEPYDNGTCDSSFFDDIYAAIFPQKVAGNDPEYTEYTTEKNIRARMQALRKLHNADYQKYLKDLRWNQLREQLEEQRKAKETMNKEQEE